MSENTLTAYVMVWVFRSARGRETNTDYSTYSMAHVGLSAIPEVGDTFNIEGMRLPIAIARESYVSGDDWTIVLKAGPADVSTATIQRKLRTSGFTVLAPAPRRRVK